MEPTVGGNAGKWEEYQSQAFKRLEAEGKAVEGKGRIASYKVGPSASSISISGEYTSVPLAELLTEQDVMSKVVLPALGLQPQENTENDVSS